MTIHELVLCRIQELADLSSRGFSLRVGEKKLELFLVRQGTACYAYHNRCPHTGAPLEWMPDEFLDYEGKYIQCAFHGALFRINDGYCIHGPCAGQSLKSIPVKHDKEGLTLSLDL